MDSRRYPPCCHADLETAHGFASRAEASLRRRAAIPACPLSARAVPTIAGGIGGLGLQPGHRWLVRDGRKPLWFPADRMLVHQLALESSVYSQPAAAMTRFPTDLLCEQRIPGVDRAKFPAAVAGAPESTDKLAAIAGHTPRAASQQSA